MKQIKKSFARKKRSELLDQALKHGLGELRDNKRTTVKSTGATKRLPKNLRLKKRKDNYLGTNSSASNLLATA